MLKIRVYFGSYYPHVALRSRIPYLPPLISPWPSLHLAQTVSRRYRRPRRHNPRSVSSTSTGNVSFVPARVASTREAFPFGGISCRRRFLGRFLLVNLHSSFGDGGSTLISGYGAASVSFVMAADESRAGLCIRGCSLDPAGALIAAARSTCDARWIFHGYTRRFFAPSTNLFPAHLSQIRAALDSEGGEGVQEAGIYLDRAPGTREQVGLSFLSRLERLSPQKVVDK